MLSQSRTLLGFVEVEQTFRTSRPWRLRFGELLCDYIDFRMKRSVDELFVDLIRVANLDLQHASDVK